MTWDARVCSSRSSSASSIAPRDSTPHLSLVLGSWYNGWAFGGSHRDARHDLCQEGSPMLPLAQGIVLPLLIKIFGGLLAGALAVSALNNPDVQQMIQAAKPSVGVVLSERLQGSRRARPSSQGTAWPSPPTTSSGARAASSSSFPTRRG